MLDFPKESQISIPDPTFPKQIPDPNLGLSITMPNRRKFNQIPEIKESVEDPLYQIDFRRTISFFFANNLRRKERQVQTVKYKTPYNSKSSIL